MCEHFKKLYHYTSFENALQIIISQSLKASKPSDTNDPFECLPHFVPADGRKVPDGCFQKLIEEYFNFISFSETLNNSVMCSHYAKKHSGVILEFDFETYPFNELAKHQIFPRKVDYKEHNKRIVFYEDEYLAVLNQDKEAAHAMVMEVLKTKEKAWEYEEEVRVFLLRDFKSNGDVVWKDANGNVFLRFELSSLTSICCGCKMTDTNILTMKKLVEIRGQAESCRPKVEKLVLSKTDFGFEQM